MKKVFKKLNEIYAKGSDVGMTWFKTVFYYSFVPALLFLGTKRDKGFLIIFKCIRKV